MTLESCLETEKQETLVQKVRREVKNYCIDTSIKAIYEITKRHTGEYAVRPFLERYPAKMLSVMKDWSKDQSFHVRRLACEGVRPRLPWAKNMEQFLIDPTPVLPILENLKEDESLFVRKSVANNLNDILKDNYEIVQKIDPEIYKMMGIKPDQRKEPIRKRMKVIFIALIHNRMTYEMILVSGVDNPALLETLPGLKKLKLRK
jgi:3-methyladenine DNA glycosylase AlkC